jgi:hypothetical protein
VNPKIAGKWMFIPLKMVCIGIDPYPYVLFLSQFHMGKSPDPQIHSGSSQIQRASTIGAWRSLQLPGGKGKKMLLAWPSFPIFRIRRPVEDSLRFESLRLKTTTAEQFFGFSAN